MKMKKLLSVAIVLGLVGCKPAPENSTEQPLQDTTQYKEQLEINPEVVGYLSYELGDLVKNLMLDEQQEFLDWDHRANDEKIRWMTQGYQENYDANNRTYHSIREGLVRVHVLGHRVSELKDRKYEVPWLVTYLGEQAKFGVSHVDIQPTGNFKSFGDPLPSFKKAGIQYTVVCQRQQYGEIVNAYKIHARGKTDMYLMDITSSGSAGSSQWLSLSTVDLSQDWCKNL